MSHREAGISYEPGSHATSVCDDGIAHVAREFVILGAGLTGLAAATALGARATVLERADRPGGLVRTENFGGYWFDHVIHLLYFADEVTETRIKAMLGEVLLPCPPCSFVEFGDGVVPFPFQTHLAGLPFLEIVKCIRDFAFASACAPRSVARSANYEELLKRAFGKAMCERFFFPYNRKTWKRPLSTLGHDGLQWNLARPSLASVIRGAVGRSGDPVYNGKGWYPRPHRGSPCRGMEVLARALAANVTDLHLNSVISCIDVERREIATRTGSGVATVRWLRRCLNTLPLPTAIALCPQAPLELRTECARLPYNRVRSVALSVEGPRPSGRGHWRYYPDPSLAFSRLVYMCEFDPDLAPPSGWGLLAEVSERMETNSRPAQAVINRVCADALRIGAIPGGCRIVNANVLDVDPAYVVFSPHTRAVVEAAHAFLQANDIDSLGRYGKWEYSSMAQVMRDGFAWADSVLQMTTPRATGP